MHADKKKKKKNIYIYIYILQSTYFHSKDSSISFIDSKYSPALLKFLQGDLLADLLYSEQMSLSNLTTVIFLSTSSKYFLAWWSTF